VIAHRRWPVLMRMGNDLRQRGTSRRSTAALMWSAYCPHAVATVMALTQRPSLSLPGALAHPLGPVATCAGAGLLITGPTGSPVRELTGTAVQRWPPVASTGTAANRSTPATSSP
jgi:hypothetical protein